MAIQEADDDEQEEDDNDMLNEDNNSNMSWTSTHRSVRVRSDKKVVEWVGEPIKDDGRRVFYR